MSAPWLAIYRNFDDDALAALASVGLVRRAAKDVEAGKVDWIEAPGVLGVDGQRVLVDAGGPGKASCDCPAPGICKHILAASIWLRAAPVDAVQVDVLAEVLALAPAALWKAAGGVATRRAHALFKEAPAGQATALSGALVIALPGLDFSCRYIAGAGFAGMVSEHPAAALHLLALATVWRAHGQAFPWPAALTAASDAAFEAALSDAERQFIARVRQLLLEACRSGWSHMSEVMPAQLRALALSARVEAFPRLAAMLRTLAATTALLVARDIGADERQAIGLAARIHALCQALDHGTGTDLDALRGTSRRSFDDSAALELLPLGAHWWEQRSGARGLTISFWDPQGATVMQAVLARRDGSDPGFHRQQAWSAHALWQGAGTAQQLAGGAIALEHVRVSGDRNVSLSTDTRARVLAPWTVQDARWQVAGFSDWRELARVIQASAGLRGEPLAALLLRPASCDAPWLDETRQLFHWVLRDQHGAPLALRLSCAALHHARIANIEAWMASGTPVLAVLARFETGHDGTTLEPVSLVVGTGAMLRAVALDFEAPAHTTPSLLGRLTRMLQPKPGAVQAPAAIPIAGQFAWIDALQEALEHKAMTGRLHLPGSDGARLAQVRDYLRATGVDSMADAVQRYLDAPGAENALVLHYLCQVCAQLDTGPIGSQPG